MVPRQDQSPAIKDLIKKVISRALGAAGLLTLSCVALSWAPSQAAPQVAPWHLDRINQRTLPLDGNVTRPQATGSGIDIYVIDVNVRRTHEQFGGRAKPGWNAITRTADKSTDIFPSGCVGHGTHVAGLAAGSTVGVASGANVIPVIVLDCENGDGELDDVVAGVNWIRQHHQSGRLAIANLSLGVDLGVDGERLNDAIRALIADGVVVTVAAGNNLGVAPVDACKVAPPNEPQVITVAASTSSDRIASYSYQGSCVDIIAPGGEAGATIESSWSTADNAYGGSAGTSMASPLVAGYAAILAGQQPTLCPSQIFDAVVSRATPNAVQGLVAGTPNKLLYLDASPVIGTTTPGVPTNITLSASNRAIYATWDTPCDGGSAITAFNLQVLRAGVPVRNIIVPAGTNAVRIPGLQNGVAYKVAVNAVNVVGAGAWSTTSPRIKPLDMRHGTTYLASTIITGDGNTNVKFSVRAVSASVCAVQAAPLRLVARSVGTCRLSVLPRNASVRVIHKVRIS